MASAFGISYSLWGIQKFPVCEGMVSLDQLALSEQVWGE